MTKAFGAQSTTDEVLEGMDLSGKRILVTGASAGLGVETVRTLVAHGADVVGAVRDLDKARAATAGVRPGANGGSLELIEADLASLSSLRAAADALQADGRPFDVIINNAAVMACPLGRTADGFELQFGTNHLGHFVFTNRIASLIRPGGRVVSVASAGHHFGEVDLEDPNYESAEYDPFVAYGRSKTANILFAVEFDRRHAARGVRATALHPGVIDTELGRHLPDDTMDSLVETMDEQQRAAGGGAFSFKSIPQGAATSVWAGIKADADAVGGRYCEDCHVAELSGPQDVVVPHGVREYALDPDLARALWTKSEELVGETFATA